MKYEVKKIIHGLSKYIDAEIYSNMNDLQEFAARVMIGRLIANEKGLEETLVNNGFIRTFGIVDGDGMVELEDLVEDIKRELNKKGSLSVSIPMFGKLTFKPADVDVMYRHITGKEYVKNESNQAVY